MERIESFLRPKARELRLVAAFFLAATVLFTWPLAPHAWSGFVGGKTDPLLNTWIISWDARTIFSHPTGLFQGNILYPCRDVLAYSEHLFALGLLASPVYFVTGNPVFSYNFVLLLGFVLSGLGCYLLIRELTGSRWGALVGGLFFAFCPFKISQLSHIHVTFSAFLPFLVLYLHRYLERGRGGDLALFGAFFLAQSLSSWHYLLYSAIAALLYCAWRAAFSRGKGERARPAVAVAVMLLAVAITLPFALPYLRAHARLPDFKRSLDETRYYSAGLGDYLNVMPQSFVYRYMPFTRLSYMGSELILFPGLVTLALAACALFVKGKDVGAPSLDRRACRREKSFFLLLSALGVLLAAGPRIAGVANLLYTIPYHAGPFKLIRVPSRFFVLTALGLSVLAGFGLANIVSRLAGEKGGARSFRLVSFLVLLLLVLDLFVFDLGIYSPGGEVPEVYSWLKEQEEAEIIELPAEYSDLPRQALFMYYSTVHWRKTANGISGYYPYYSRAIFEEMRGFPSRGSVELLRGLGIDYVIWHREFLDRESARAYDERIRSQTGLAVAGDFGDQQVLRVLPGESASARDLKTTLARECGEGGGCGVFLRVENTAENAFVAVDEDPQPFTLRYLDRTGATLKEIRGDYRAPFFVLGGEAAVLPLGSGEPPPAQARAVEVELTGGVLGERSLRLDLGSPAGTSRGYPLLARLLFPA